MKVHKLNDSYSYIDSDQPTLSKIHDFLKVTRPGCWHDPMVKSGFKSPYDFFSSVQHNKLLVMNGHIRLLANFGVPQEELVSEYTENDINMYLNEIKDTLPFEPYDFQENAFRESILNTKQINRMCTSSGKSMTISLIADFLRRKDKKGVLLVPNINLLTQFKNDIEEYNLMDLHADTHIIGGGNNDRHFNNALTISTWQSLQNWHDDLDKLDYVITDEAHRFASEETSAIVKNTVNCKYKWGFTGTIPEDPTMKMQLIGMFGLPVTYITSRELIDRGLATPVHIQSIILKYSKEDKKIFKESGGDKRGKSSYPKQLKFLKDHDARNNFVVNLTCKLKSQGNTLVLFQHTEHGKLLFIDTMKKLYPDVQVNNKDITGKKSFEFQEKYGVYFLNGEDDAKTRELTRKILEEDYFKITLEDDTVIRIHGDKEILLANGSKKFAKNLTEIDEIDDDFINTLY